jgi:hypothetical protein
MIALLQSSAEQRQTGQDFSVIAIGFKQGWQSLPVIRGEIHSGNSPKDRADQFVRKPFALRQPEEFRPWIVNVSPSR